MVASNTLITVSMMSWPLIKIKFDLKYVTVEERVDFYVLGDDYWQVFDKKVAGHKIVLIFYYVINYFINGSYLITFQGYIDWRIVIIV